MTDHLKRLRTVGKAWAGILLPFIAAAAMAGLLPLSTIGVSSAKPAKEEEQQAAPAHGYPRGVTIITLGRNIKTIDPVKLEATKKVYEKWAKGIGEGPMTLTAMKEIYKVGDFDTVKTLIENGTVRPEHSTDMADLRILMTLQVWEGIVDDSGGKLRIHRSDSGNQKVGMASDADQSVYVEEYEDGRWIRVENEDGKMPGLFKRKLEALHKLTPEALGVDTFAGRDKHPDWRVTSVQLDADGRRRFDVHAAETLFTLKRSPGAYTFCGAVVQQMQLRVLDAMENQLRSGRQAPEIKDPREIRVPELRDHNKAFRLNHLVFNTIEADPETGKARAREAFREDATRVLFDGLPPKLVEGHAYDAAVANYYEFMRHINDAVPDVKYHLRALDDGFQLLERLRKGEARFEYANVHKDHRAEHLARIFGDSLAKAPPDLNGRTFLSRWQTAFDISANLRDLHNKNKLTDAAAELAFKPLAEEIAGPDKVNWKKHLGKAREEYNRRCQEFMIHNICATSKERIGEFLAPDPDSPAKRAILEKAIDEGTLRTQLKLEGKRNDAKWKGVREEFLRNYSEQARLQLLYSFRELNATRPDVVDFILKEAQRNGHTPEQMALLRQVNSDSKSYFLGLREFSKFPKTYARYAHLAVRVRISQLGRSIMAHLAGEYGFVETHEGPRPSNLLKTLGMNGLHEQVQSLLKQRKLLGVTDRFLGNTFLNIGAVQSGVNVLRAYSESGGDPEELRNAIIRESVMILPGVGQAYGSYEAGADWKQQLLVIVPLFIPELGMVMAVYGIGEAGVVMYQCEYLVPLANDLADALYRGYVGPSLHEFSQESHPPEFTEEDEKRLESARRQIKSFADRMKTADATKGDAQALAIAGRDERLLSGRKSAWKAYLGEQHRYEGSAILGSGRHMKQEPIDVPAPTDPLFKDESIGMPGPLLAVIKPIVFYSRSIADGPVDFTVKPLTSDQLARIGVLQKVLDADDADPLAWVDAEVEHAALLKQQKAFGRAQRYLESARKNADLMLQIRLDSLWPNLQAGGPDQKGWARDWVAKWVSVRRDVLPDALAKVGVRTDGVKPWSRDVLDSLGERLEQDIERSRRLWLINQFTEKARATWEKEQIQKKKGALMGERLAIAARDLPATISNAARKVLLDVGVDPLEATTMSAVAESYLQRCVPESPPAVKIGVRRVPAPGSGSKTDFRFRTDVKVTANPAIYCPPYTACTYLLDPKSAQDAANASKYRSLPLSGDMVKSLKEYLAEVGPPTANPDPEKDIFAPAVLTFVFCADVRIPERLVPETINDLPKLDAYDIPFPDGMTPPAASELASLDENGQPSATAGLRGYLFGGGAFAPKPDKVVTGPLQIKLMRMKRNPWNGIEITSQALAQLETNKPEQGLKFAVLRSESAGGPFVEFNRVFLSYCFGDTAVFKPTEQEPEPMFYGQTCVRVGKDKFLIQDHMTPRNDDKWPHKPAYYQIVQTPVLRDDADKARGKEVKSNIAGPGEAELFLWPNTDSSGKPSFRTDSDGWYSFGGKLGLNNQAYDVLKPRFTVSSGKWTGHFWNGALKVRIPPEGATLRVTAEGEGMSASGSLEVPGDPERQKQAAEALGNAQKQLAEGIASRSNRVVNAKQRFDSDKRWLDAQPNPASQSARDWVSWLSMKYDFVRSRYGYRCEALGESPRLALWDRRHVAEAAGDYGAACDLHLAEYDIAVALDPIEEERKSEVGTLLAKVKGLSIPASDSGLKEAAGRLQVDLEANLRQRDSIVPTSKFGAIQGALYAAYCAGDAGKFEAALGKAASIPLRDDRDKNDLVRTYHDAAERLFTLTGDGSKAAAILNKARAMDLELNPQQAENCKKNWERNPPAWWPEK